MTRYERHQLAKVPVKMRFHQIMIDHLAEMALEKKLPLSRFIGDILEEATNALKPAKYQLNDMTDTYVLTRNANQKVGSKQLKVYINQETCTMIDTIASHHGSTAPEVRTSLLLDYLNSCGIL